MLRPLHRQLPTRDHDASSRDLHLVREYLCLDETGAPHGGALFDHLDLTHSGEPVRGE
jgi:hypothetical protein